MEKVEILDTDTKEKETETNIINPLKKIIKNKDSTIKLMFFLVNVFFSIFLIALFLYYGKGMIEIYNNTPELTLATFIILTRIGIMFSFCYYMFKKWFAQEKRYLKNIPFLVGLFFYFSAIGKFLDILLYIYHFSPNGEDETFLILAKIRQLFFIITFIPLLYLGLRPFLYSIGLKKQWNEKKVLNLRRDLVFIYAFSFGFLIFIAYNSYFIQLLTAIMSVLTYCFMVYLFRFAYKHNTFPTIKANFVSFGFLFYIFSTPSSVILPIILFGILSIEQCNLISEGLNFTAMIIIFLGFVRKPK